LRPERCIARVRVALVGELSPVAHHLVRQPLLGLIQGVWGAKAAGLERKEIHDLERVGGAYGNEASARGRRGAVSELVGEDRHELRQHSIEAPCRARSKWVSDCRRQRLTRRVEVAERVLGQDRVCVGAKARPERASYVPGATSPPPKSWMGIKKVNSSRIGPIDDGYTLELPAANAVLFGCGIIVPSAIMPAARCCGRRHFWRESRGPTAPGGTRRSDPRSPPQ